jgi:hypothetical protein
MKRLRKLLVGLLVTFVSLVGLALGLIVLAVLFVLSPPGERFVAARLEGALDGASPAGDARIGGVALDASGGVTLTDFALSDADGRPMIAARRLVVDLDLRALLDQRVHARSVVADALIVDVGYDADGVLDVMRAFGQTAPSEPSTEPWAGLPIDLELDLVVLRAARVRYSDSGAVVADVVVDGTAAVAGSGRLVRVSEVSLLAHADAPVGVSARVAGAVDYTGDQVVLDGLSLALPGSRVTLGGAVTGLESALRVDVDAEVQQLDLRSIDPIAGRPGLRGRYAGRVGVHGPLDALEITGSLDGQEPTRGALTVDASLDLLADTLAWRAKLGLTQVRVDDAYAGLGGDVLLDGALSLSGVGTSYPDDLVVTGGFVGKAQTFFGMEVDGLDLAVELRDGNLEVVDAGLVGLVGSVRTKGGFNLGTGALSQVVSGTLDLRRLAGLGVPDLRGTGPIRLTVTGDTFAEGAPIEARGTVVLRDFGWTEDVTFEQVDLQLVVRVRDGVTEVTADALGARGVLYGSTVASLHLPDLAVRVDDAATTVTSRTARFEALAYDGVVTIGAGTGGLAVRVPSVGDTSVTTGLALEAVDLRGHRSPSGTLDVTVAGDNVGLQVDLAGPASRGGALLAAGLAYNTATQDLVVDRLSMQPTDGAFVRADAPIRLRLVDGGAEQVAVALTTAAGTVRIDAPRIATSGALSASFSVERLDLATLGAFAPEADGLEGVVTLNGSLVGAYDAPLGLVQVDGQGLARVTPADPAVPESVPRRDGPLDLSGTVGFEPGRVRVEARVGSGGPLVDVAGVVPVRFGASPGLDLDGAADLTAVVRAGPLARLAGLAGVAAPAGEVSAVVQVTGPVRDPELTARGVVEVDVPGWEERGRVEFDLQPPGRGWAYWAELRQGLIERGAIVGTATNRLDEVTSWALGGGGAEPDLEDYGLFFDDIDLSVAAIGVPVASLMAASGSAIPMSGEVVGGARVSGRWFAPVVEGSLDWIADPNARGPAALVSGGFVSFVPTEGGYRVDGELMFADEGSFVVGGTVPVTPDLRDADEPVRLGDVDFVYSGTKIPLALAQVFDPGIIAASGVLAIDGTLAGPADTAFPAFSMTLVDGSLTYAPTAIRYEDITVAMRADSSSVAFEKVSLRTVPLSDRLDLRAAEALPNLVMFGRIGLDGGDPASVALNVTLDDAWLIANEDERFRMSGEIVASGPWSAPKVRTADGPLTLQSGTLVLDAAAFLSTGPLELDPVVVVHRASAPAVAEEAEVAEASMFEDVDVDIAIDLIRNLELQVSMPYIDDLGALGAAVTRADMTARLGGEVRARTIAGKGLNLTGEVEVIEGLVRVMQSQFDLSEGTISFPSGDYANPEMNLAGTMAVTGGAVDLAVGGTANEPELELSSAEWPDQTQILSILITGRSPDDLSDDQGNATAGALAGLLLNSVMGGARIGSVSIEPNGSIRVVLPPIARNVFAESVLSPTAEIDENRFTVEVEWAALRRLIVQASYGDVVKTADLFWEFRF